MGNIADTRGMSGSFTTLSYDPIAVTLPPTLVSKTTATLNGSCDFKGLAGTAKFEYWKVAKVPVIIATATQSFAASPSTYLVKQAITGLTAATSYTYRVQCINASAAVNGLPVTFKTTR